MSDSRKYLLATGVVLILSGLVVLTYSLRSRNASGVLGEGETKALPKAELEYAHARIREGQEFIRQNSRRSARQALEIFNQVLSQNLDPDVNQTARYGLGVALVKCGDRARALRHFRQLKEEGVVRTELRDKNDYSLGRILLQINHETEGRSILERLLARTNENYLKSKVHAAFGDYFMSRGNLKRARENYAVALKYFPDNVHAELARADAVRGTSPAGSAYEYYDDYLVGISNLDPRKRRKVIRRLSKQYYREGLASYRSRNFHTAKGQFQKALTSRPSAKLSERSLYWLAESYDALGNSNKALSYFSRVTRNSVSEMDQPALIKKGIILFKRHKYKQAAKLFQTAEDNYPNAPYTARAREWRQEAEATIRENSDLEINNEQRQVQPAGERKTDDGK